jgi:hypothetical protein
MMTNSSNFSWKIKFIKVLNVAKALHNLKNMTKNSYNPYLVHIVVFPTSSSIIQIW